MKIILLITLVIVSCVSAKSAESNDRTWGKLSWV